jgi:hypothetical protein
MSLRAAALGEFGWRTTDVSVDVPIGHAWRLVGPHVTLAGGPESRHSAGGSVAVVGIDVRFVVEIISRALGASG